MGAYGSTMFPGKSRIYLWIPVAVLIVFQQFGPALLLRTGDKSRIPEFFVYRPWFKLTIDDDLENLKQLFSNST